jgi:hypothetical protein
VTLAQSTYDCKSKNPGRKGEKERMAMYRLKALVGKKSISLHFNSSIDGGSFFLYY